MTDRSEVTSLAVFCDFENIALGVRDAEYEKFDMRKVLERLLLKGSIVVKKAYCDWDRYKAFKAAMHEASFELIEIPHVRQSGKNSADIRMVVDALDLCYTKSHVDTFVIVSGDSDFSPLVSKLRENNKNVIGVGVKNSTSDLLIANCDEFIFYDDLVREQRRRSSAKRATKVATKSSDKPEKTENGDKAPKPEVATKSGRKRAAKSAETEAAPVAAAKKGRASRTRSRRTAAGDTSNGAAPAEAPSAPTEMPVAAMVDESFPAASNDDAASTAAEEAAPPRESTEDERKQRAIDLVIGTLEGLLAERGDNDIVWGSMVKQTLKRRQPGFNETYYGFRSFNALLEEAQARGLIVLTRDDKSGGFKLRLA